METWGVSRWGKTNMHADSLRGNQLMNLFTCFSCTHENTVSLLLAKVEERSGLYHVPLDLLVL